jgi:hypothetical protein
MQVSALHTIIAAQQAQTARPQRPAAATAEAKAAPPAQGFEPLAFAGPSTEAAQAPAQPAYSASAPLGSQVDIRV